MATSAVAQLPLGISLVFLSRGPWQLAIAVAVLSITAVAATTMLKRWRIAFTIAAGSMMVLQCCALVLLTDLGFAGAWLALGIGLTCLLVGNQALLSNISYENPNEQALSVDDIISATRRSFWRIVAFVAIVMACSLLVLFLVLALNLGTLTIPLLLVAGLLVMASLYYLATRGGMLPNEEKPNI